MNTLSTTKVFTMVDKLFNLSNIMKKAEFNDYTIDRDLYDYLVNITRTYKFTLAKFVTKQLDSGAIKPLLFAVPKNDKSKPITFPTSLDSIIVPDKVNRGCIALFDTSSRARYEKNNVSKELEAYTCDERYFYACAQRAYINRFVTMNRQLLDNNPKFVKTITSLYGKLMTTALSGCLGGSSKGDWMQRLNYISLVFCLQNFFGYDMEKARNYAFSFPGIDKAYIMENCYYYSYFNQQNNARFMDMSSEGIDKAYANVTKDKKPYPVDVFVTLLSKEFADMRKDKLSYRTIINTFMNRYGQNSIFALEHAETFLNMILSSGIKCNLYNDLVVSNYSEGYLKDLEDIIYTIASKGD